MLKIIWCSDGIEYILGGGQGSWAKSYEKEFYAKGTCRLIKGELMYLYTRYSVCWWSSKYEYNWVPVDISKNNWEHLEKWVKRNYLGDT